MPLIGMSFFWTYFRYQAFFGILYPTHSTLSSYTLFLTVLLILSLAMLPLSKTVEKFFRTRRGMVFACTAVGTFGAGLAFLVEQEVLGPIFLELSTPLIALSFLAGYLAWALHFSYSFDLGAVVMLAGSFLISLLVFPALGFIGETRVVLAILTPIVVGFTWYVSPHTSDQTAETERKPLGEATPYLVLFIIFLLAGSIIRGIIDTLHAEYEILGFRWIASLIVAFAILAGCWYFYRKRVSDTKRKHSTGSLNEYRAIQNMTLVFWIGLAILFLTGMFLGLLSGTYDIGGHIVVIARSTLDFLLWILLCNAAYYKKAAPLPLFIICGILTEVVSWFLSYIIVPHIMFLETDTGMATSDILVLSTVFALVILMIVVFGAIALRRQPEKRATPTTASTNGPDLGIPEDKVAEYKLTAREVEVIRLFAQGHSMKKVASLLFISPSTAQSHIKSGYRKLDIHSKDELIELIGAWNREMSP